MEIFALFPPGAHLSLKQQHTRWDSSMPLLYIVIAALLTCQPSVSKHYDSHNKENKFKTFIDLKCYHFPYQWHRMSNVIYLKYILNKMISKLYLRKYEHLIYLRILFDEIKSNTSPNVESYNHKFHPINLVYKPSGIPPTPRSMYTGHERREPHVLLTLLLPFWLITITKRLLE